MFEIKNNTIRMTRGDYCVIECNLKDGDGITYEMQEGDTLTLTVREIASAESPIIFSIASETNILEIEHDDTKDLDIGSYSADIQLTMADGKRFTFWPHLNNIIRTKEKNFKNFEICPEVTLI